MPQSFLRVRFFCPHGSPAAPDVFRTAPACACHLPFLPRRAFALPFDERLFLSLRAFGCRTFACVKRPAARLFARAARRGEAEKFSRERLCPQRAARRFGARLVFRKSVLPGYANTYPFFSATSNRTFYPRQTIAYFICGHTERAAVVSATIKARKAPAFVDLHAICERRFASRKPHCRSYKIAAVRYPAPNSTAKKEKFSARNFAIYDFV